MASAIAHCFKRRPTFGSAVSDCSPFSLGLYLPDEGDVINSEFQALPATECRLSTVRSVAPIISLRAVAQFTKQQSLLDFQIKHLKEVIFAECAIVVGFDSTR